MVHGDCGVFDYDVELVVAVVPECLRILEAPEMLLLQRHSCKTVLQLLPIPSKMIG